ncbi:MAG: fumarate reductase/succinate dehydrogenase flavoprotein subunit, partial [Deltaproteobacteria bacterium]|nr:fumarate reductase/succinate dehydrogenase flavoprotein subunit [Deltaproteobacteria bacterium]
GRLTADELHRQLGKIMWDYCGMSRNREGLKIAHTKVCELKESFEALLMISDRVEGFNQSLEHALRVKDFIDLSEIMILDALAREESCGGHFREEYQTQEGEALRNDMEFSHVAVWFHGEQPKRGIEPLNFEFVKPTERSYK